MIKETIFIEIHDGNTFTVRKGERWADVERREREQREREEADRRREEAAKARAAEIAAAEQARARGRPSDDDIIDALSLHFRVHESTVIGWLIAMDLEAASARMVAAV